MTAPTTPQEMVYALAVMSGVMGYCPTHAMYFRARGTPQDVMPYYDRHLSEARRFFGSPVAFYTALKHAWSQHPERYCPGCAQTDHFFQ